MKASLRFGATVAAAAFAIGAAPAPFDATAFAHPLVAGERFLYESTLGSTLGDPGVVERIELTVLAVSASGATTIRQQTFFENALVWEATIQTDAAQHTWRYTHDGRGAGTIPVWDPVRYGAVPKRVERHWTRATADGLADGTQRVSVSGDTVTIRSDVTQSATSKDPRHDASTVVRHDTTVWSHGILQAEDSLTDVTVNGHLVGYHFPRWDRLLEHTVPGQPSAP